MDKIVLNVKNVTKTYGDRIAVNNISFQVKEGEIFGFLGPNGAGKTTAMKMICGLTSITNGEILICNYSIKSNFEKAIINLGGLIENPLMYTYLSGYENLKYYASLIKGIKKEDIIKYAKIVGLQHRLKDKVKTYSLGMRQRLGIAQALLHSPKLLVLDEPLSGLDPNGVKEMRDFLKLLAKEQKIAILISSHMLGDMEQLCDTIGIINNGQLLEVKKINDIRIGVEDSKKIRIKVDYPNFAGKVIIEELKYECQVAGNSILVYSNENNISKITQVLINHNLSIMGIDIVIKSLEQVFLEIINKYNNSTNIT